MAYMGHIISAAYVAMNSNKVEAVATWPQPRSACAFLGLTGYNCRFIQDFETMEAPLTQLLKKDGYQLTDAATTAFQALKEALSTALVLHLPNFAKPFTVDCDVSGTDFGAVLHQGTGPLTSS